MRRWNGWGDDANHYPVKKAAVKFVENLLGKATPLTDATLDTVLAQVPASRLPDHPLITSQLISIDPEERVRHARGQSFPDWLAMRSGEFGVFPDGVAFAQDGDDVKAIMQFALDINAILIPYGGGTSVVGHITPQANERAIITVDMSRMNQLLNLDEESQLATFGPGVAGPYLEAQLRSRGYVLGHFPQSFELATLGGWVASRSSGQQSMRYGRIEQMFAGATVETPTGTLEVPTFPASSAGPDMRETILGSEGRMGIITQVKVRVTPLPEKEAFYVVFVSNWSAALQLVRSLVQSKVPLSMLRLSNPVETMTQLALAADPVSVALLQKYLTLRGVGGEQQCMMTFGITGSTRQCRQALLQANRIVRSYKAVNTGTLLGKKWQHSRFRSPYLRHSLWDLGYVVDTLETATDWPNVDPMVQAIEAAISGACDSSVPVHVFTHLSHLYAQGSSVYTTYVFPAAATYEETLARWRLFKARGSEAVIKHHGTISHQHGVGTDHAEYLAAEKGERGMRLIKNTFEHFDPTAMMNPGKLFRD